MDMLAIRGIVEDFLDGLANPEGVLVIAGSLVVALVVVVLAFILARLLRSSVSSAVLRADRSANLASLLGNLARIGTYIAAGIIILRVFGATWTGVVAAIGVLSLAVSLAVQDVLKSFVAGIYLLLERPFSIGDTIKVGDAEGRVEAVDVRTTVLRCKDCSRVIVPNSTVFAQVVTEKSRRLRKLTLQLEGLPLAVEPVQKRIYEVLAGFPGIAIEPAPVIRLQEVKEGKAGIGVEVWVETEGLLLAGIANAMMEAFPEARVSGKASD